MFYWEKEKREAFAIYRGLVIEALLFSREIWNKLVLRNVSFLLKFDFSPILLFFSNCLVWQTLRILAEEKQFCCKCDFMHCIWSCFVCRVRRSTGSLQSYRDIMYKRFSLWLFILFPSKLTFCIFLIPISIVHPRSDWRLKFPSHHESNSVSDFQWL